MYTNRFTDGEGREQEGLSTMFAATEARSFFPCWDQPDLKCSYQLRVFLPSVCRMDVLSNMNKASFCYVTCAIIVFRTFHHQTYSYSTRMI